MGARVIRSMPNTAAMALAGATAIAPGTHATANDILVARALFNRADLAMIATMESNQKGKQAPRRRFHCRTRGPVCAPRFTSRG